MRRALMTILLFLAVPAAADAATVKVVDCVPALDPVARTATFEARMRAARSSERMQVRFSLQVREDAVRGWRRVVADGFDTWLTSLPDVRRYSYAKTVVNLAAPAAYRTVVRFRWLDADGLVLRSARVTSAACRQPDFRPDLEPLRVEVAPGPDAGTRRYTAVVRNAGRSAAGPFDVGLDDAVEHVPGLAAGEQRAITFTAPACEPGATPELTLDPGAAVVERDEDDNAFAATCPG